MGCNPTEECLVGMWEMWKHLHKPIDEDELDDLSYDIENKYSVQFLLIMKEEYFIQMVKDIRKLKKKLHKTNTKFKRKIESLENENKTLKSKLKKCETELSYCKKYDIYYEY